MTKERFKDTGIENYVTETKGKERKKDDEKNEIQVIAVSYTACKNYKIIS